MGLDLRQHVATLIAVFLALVVGILVGVSLSREERLEGRIKDLVGEFKGIRDENVGLRDQVGLAEKELERRAALERLALPGLVGGQLNGAKIALIYTSETKRVKFECELPTLLTTGGASIVSETVIARDFESSVTGIKPDKAARLGIAAEVTTSTVTAKLADSVTTGEEQGLEALGSLGLVQTRVFYPVAPNAVVVFASPKQGDESRCQSVDVPLLEALTAKNASLVVGLASDVPAAIASLYRQKAVAVVEGANTIPGQVELVEALQRHLKEAGEVSGPAHGVVPGSSTP